MIKVKIKKDHRKFTVPIPYALLTIISALMASKTFQSIINKSIQKDGNSFKVPQIDRKDLQPLLKALSAQKGLKLVETKLADGTEVSVTL